MLNSYQQFTLRYVLYELDMVTGFVLYNWAFENEPVHKFGGVRMVNSYASREADTLFIQLEESIEKYKEENKNVN